MSDDLRTRIAAVLYNRVPYAQLTFDKASDEVRAEWLADADAVIRELVGITRRCERCRHNKPFTDFPPPHKPGGPMRPFCANCTAYVEWSTS